MNTDFMEQVPEERTKQFVLSIINLVDALPKKTSATAIGRQIIRSGTSIGADYRAACRGRSKAEFISKPGIVAEEADETCFRLELIIENTLLPETKVLPPLKEADELTAICVASIKTSQKHNQKS